MAKALGTIRFAAGVVLLMTLTAFVSLTAFILVGSLVASLFGW